MYIFNVQQLENVVDTYTSFDIRHLRVHHETGEFTVACRETEEVGVAALEYVHRFTYRDNPGINKNGIRFMVLMVF